MPSFDFNPFDSGSRGYIDEIIGAVGNRIGDSPAGSMRDDGYSPGRLPGHNPSTSGNTLGFLDNIFGGLGGSIGGKLDGFDKVVDNLVSSVLDTPKKKPAKKKGAKRRRGGGSGGVAAPVDPRIAMVNSLLAPQGGGIDPNDKTFRRNNQKQINRALLQARAPWDQAIVDTRAGLKGASAAVDRAQAGVAPVMQGTMRGQDMLAQSDRASLDAARDAAMLKQAQDAQAMARSLGISETAATEAGAAANISTQAEAAGQLGDVDRRTDNAKGLASSIQQASTLGAQETKQNLIRDNEREINRLRAQRSMGMAQARGSVEQEIAEFIREQAGASSDAALERMKMGIDLMNAVNSDAIQREGQATTRRGQDITRANARDAAIAKARGSAPNPADAFKYLTGAMGQQVRTPMDNDGDGKYDVDKSGRPIYGYGPVLPPQQAYTAAINMGMDPRTAATMTGYSPNSGGGGGSIGLGGMMLSGLVDRLIK